MYCIILHQTFPVHHIVGPLPVVYTPIDPVHYARTKKLSFCVPVFLLILDFAFVNVASFINHLHLSDGLVLIKIPLVDIPRGLPELADTMHFVLYPISGVVGPIDTLKDPLALLLPVYPGTGV